MDTDFLNQFEIKEPTTLKEKIQDRLETLWYCYIKEIPNWLRDVVFFFKTLVRFSPTLWKNYNFDYGYLISLEYKKLQLMQRYFKDSHIAVENERTYKEITLALSLLDIVKDEGGYLKPEIYVNPRTAERFCEHNPGFVEELHRQRDNNPQLYQSLLQELRIQKAWYLYNKLRYKRMFGWWD